MAKKEEEKKNKSTAKRQTKAKEKAKKPLTRVPEEHIFWCNDGRIFRDLRELAEGFMAMSDETYYYHVSSERNDFCNWVINVINDTELAVDLRMVTGRDQAASCVVARLDFYEKS